MSGKDHSSGGTRAASVFPDGGSGAADEVDTSMRGLLPAVTGTLPLRDRGDSNEDSDSSAIDSDEEEVSVYSNMLAGWIMCASY